MLIADWKKSTFDPRKDLEIDKIFRLAVKHKCSDIHLQVGRPPIFRIRGGLRELEMPPIGESQMIELTFPMMDQRNLDIFHKNFFPPAWSTTANTTRGWCCWQG
jgi:twitching motility protein PilT